MDEKEKEINNLVDLLNIFSNFEKNILMQYTNNDLTKLIFLNPENEDISTRISKLNNYIINPFKSILSWVENDILDFKSMLNALEKLDNLISEYENTISKLSEINNKINEIKTNKNKNENNYLHLLINSCSSPSENKLDILIIEQKNLENKKIDLFNIINIIYFVNEKFLEEFKNEKINKYNEQFKMFVEENKKNSEIINDLWDCISSVNNIKNDSKENKEHTLSP